MQDIFYDTNEEEMVEGRQGDVSNIWANLVRDLSDTL